MTNPAWYAARGTGVVSLILLTVVMVLGIGSRYGRPVFGLPRFAVGLVHRNASLIAVTMLAIHIATLRSTRTPSSMCLTSSCRTGRSGSALAPWLST